MYPGASETWYDGVDSDCAGDSDYDADGDGYDSTAFGGDDCADDSPEDHPGETDDLALGASPGCGGLAVAGQVHGESANEMAGESVAGGDVIGDGQADLVTVSGQRVLVLQGPIAGLRSLGDSVSSVAMGGAHRLGTWPLFEVRDLDGDGYADLQFNVLDSDSKFVALTVLGPVSGELESTSADGTLRVHEGLFALGESAGDTDGDGLPALVFDWSESPSSPDDTVIGGAALYAGPFAGADLGEDDAVATLTDASVGDECAHDHEGLGDVNGDGLDDLALGCSGVASLAIFEGPHSGTITREDATARIESYGAAPQVFGPGDLDADGYADVILYNLSIELFAYPGYNYVMLGPFSTDGAALDLAVSVAHGATFDAYFAPLALPGDLNGDGTADVVFLSDGYGADVVEVASGAALVACGTCIEGDPVWRLEADRCSTSGSGAVGDLSGDGIRDVAIAQTRADVVETDDGAIWLVTGGAW